MVKPLHYLALGVVITVSVCLGNLLSNYLTSQYVAYQANDAAKQLIINRKAQDALRKERATQANIALQKQRRLSSKAQKLLRQCNDWQQQNAERDTYISRTEMKRYCDAYTRYVQTGR